MPCGWILHTDPFLREKKHFHFFDHFLNVHSFMIHWTKISWIPTCAMCCGMPGDKHEQGPPKTLGP